MNSLNVAVAQNPAALMTGPQERFNWLAETLNDEQLRGTDILLLPELFLTGYNVGQKITDWAEPTNGTYARKIADLCVKYDIAIHYGFAECEGEKLYNAANCFGKDGTKLGGHRKLLLPPGFEGDYFDAGAHCTPFALNDFSIGTLICYDAEFPENFRHVAKMGVDLVLVPTALASQWGVVAQKLIPTRAFENGVYVCYANQSGTENGLEYLGGSCIVGPDGGDLERAGAAPELLRATLHKDRVEAAQTRLPYHIDSQKLPWV
jgi:predicted amidohydrolase